MGDWAADNWEAIMAMNPLPATRECAVPGCSREKRAKGLCLTHYRLARIKFDPEFADRVRATQRRAYRKRQAREADERMAVALGEPAAPTSPSGPHWSQPEFWQGVPTAATPEQVEGGQGVALREAHGHAGGPKDSPPAPASPEGSESRLREGS